MLKEHIQYILAKLKIRHIYYLLLFIVAILMKQFFPVYSAHATEDHFGIFMCSKVLRNDKIFVPATLTRPIMDWYHNNLIHPDTDRLFSTVS